MYGYFMTQKVHNIGYFIIKPHQGQQVIQIDEPVHDGLEAVEHLLLVGDRNKYQSEVINYYLYSC